MGDEISLREYVDIRFDASEKATAAALAAAKESAHKADMATEKRFECVAEDTLILCADLVWRAAGELRQGDELIGFDEDPEPDSGRRGRRFRRAIVTANSIAVDRLFEVVTPRGSVLCNAQHPWLTRPQDKSVNWHWVRTDELKYGDAVHHVFNTWNVDTSWESGWLAGIFDGEGCLTLDKNKRTQLSIAQRESPTANRIEAVLRKRVEFVGVHRFEPGTSSTPKNICAFFHFIVTRLPDLLTLLGSVRPPRLLDKAHIAWDRKPLGGWHRSTLVTAVNDAGVGKIAALSTSTRTYIAGGFAMHNSVNEFRAALSDNNRTLMPRLESEHKHNATSDKISALEKRLSAMEDRGRGLHQGWIIFVAVVSVIGVIFMVIKSIGQTHG